MFFETCGLVSAVIPVTDVFLYIIAFPLRGFLCTLLLSNRCGYPVVFECIFNITHTTYICSVCVCVVLHTLSLCLSKFYFICWENLGFLVYTYFSLCLRTDSVCEMYIAIGVLDYSLNTFKLIHSYIFVFPYFDS